MRKLLLVPLLLAACGDDDPVRHLDGGVDSPMVMIDAPMVSDPVTLTVTVDNAPVAGVKVYFLNPDSSVVANATTDATGVASAVMAMGGSVTAIDPLVAPQGGVSYNLYTFNGVKAGDHLKLTASFNATVTTATVTIPEDSDPTVTSYRIGTVCDEGLASPAGSGVTPTTMMYLDPTCGATATDFLVMSTDDAGKIVHYFLASNQTISTDINLSGNTWVAPTNRDYTFNNTTVLNDSISIEDYFAAAKGELIKLYPTVTSQTPPITATLAAPAFTNALEVTDVGGVAGGLAEHHVVTWAPFAATAKTVDVGANTLVDITADPAVDTSAHTVAWSEGATGLTPDFAMAYVYSSRSTPTLMSWGWQIVGPHTDTAIHFPTLPTDVADFNIGATDTTGIDVMFQMKVPGGYDAVRASIFDTINNSNSNIPSGLFTTATGTLSAEGWPYQQPQRTVPSHPWKLNKLSQLLQAKVRSLAPKALKTSLTSRRK